MNCSLCIAVYKIRLLIIWPDLTIMSQDAKKQEKIKLSQAFYELHNVFQLYDGFNSKLTLKMFL